MHAAVLSLIELVQQMAYLGLVVFLRVGAAMSLLPGFGEQSVPVRVRLALGIGFTVIVAPAVATAIGDIPPPAIALGKTIVTEGAFGLALGLVLRLSVMALQIAGAIAAQSMSLSQIFGAAATADPMPVIGNILVIAGLALAMISGLHVKLAQVLIQSYEWVPFGEFPSAENLTPWAQSHFSHAFELAFSLAAPFVVASVLYNVALGAINRAMPQLMVAFIGAPLITLGGIVLLLISAPTLLQVWLENFDRFLVRPFAWPDE